MENKKDDFNKGFAFEPSGLDWQWALILVKYLFSEQVPLEKFKELETRVAKLEGKAEIIEKIITK